MATPSLRGRGLVAVTVILLAIFAGTVVLRAPWRGHLATGDQWVTALALRWVKTWHRDGAMASKLALVESPPTAEFAGEHRVVKWGLPGQMLLLHAVAEAFGAEPDVELLNRVALATHLVLALVLAGAASLLAPRVFPGRPAWWAPVALHCGAFTLLFPPILYWGQNITAQDFTVLPLFVVVVVGRWLRASVSSSRARVALDAAVATSVFLGIVSEYYFWVIVPYLVVARLIAARRDRPRPDDPWLLTLVLPFALAVGFLGVVFVANGQLALVRWRLASWTTGGAGAGFVGVRLVLFVMFLKGHFADAFGLIGVLALVLAAWKLVPRGRVPGLVPEVRGILLDLLLPCLLYSLLLAHHQAFHTISAIKYVPFVALTWTVLVPRLLLDARRRSVLLAAYGLVAALAILPFSSNYPRYFPPPERQWDDEAAFLRETTRPTDTVVSTVTQIELVPPQRIALAERRVTLVYGPLELLQQTTALRDDATIALYGPCETHRAFGVTEAEVTARGERCVARFPVGRLRQAMQRRPDADFRAHAGDVLRGDLRPTGATSPRPPGPLPAPRRPLAIHATDAQRVWLGAWDRLYWVDDDHLHWRASQAHAPSRELVVLGDDRFATDWMALWRPVPSVDPAPLAWGKFVLDAFARAATSATTTSAWRGYDVVTLPPAPPPALLATRVPAVTAWRTHLVLRADVPVGMALEPAGGDAPNPPWVVVLFDDLPVALRVPDDVSGEWTVQHD